MKLKIIAILAALSAALFVSSPPALAADLEVTAASPLFPGSTVWYPGLSVTKQFTVKNNGSATHTVIADSTNEHSTGDLDNMMTVKLGSFDGTMHNFWNSGEINLGDLTAGASQTYDMTVGFNAGAGNDFQNKSATFDLTIGFLGTGEQLRIGGVAGASTGGGGGGDGSVCNDSKPGSAPVIISAVAGANSVTLTWTSAGNPVSYYLITYGTEPGAQTYGNPKVGGPETTSYTINGLSGGVTYYFRVRAGNGCMPGDFSEEISATPGGGVTVGPAQGFAPGVLGAQDNLNNGVATGPAEVREVLGEATESCQSCLWWPFLLAQVVILFLLRKHRFIWSVAASALVFLVFLFFNRTCLSFSPCWRNLLLALVILLIIRFILVKIFKKYLQ